MGRKRINNGKYIDDQMGNGVPSGGTTGQVLVKNSATDYDYGWGEAGGSVDLLSNFDTSSTSAVNTNLSFPIAANERYTVRVWGHVSKAISNTGLKVGVGAPSGCTVTGTEFRGGAAYSTALTNGEISAINTLGGTFATGIGVKVPFRMEFRVINGSTAGSITILFATVTSNTATMYAGSYMNWEKSTGV